MRPRLQGPIPFFYSALSIILTLYLLNYFSTGLGGSMLLAATLIPILLMMDALASLKKGEGLYPRLGRRANYIIAGVYAALCLIVSVYMHTSFNDLIYIRLGSYNTTDVIVGAIALALVMEYARRKHFALFLINAFLMFYSIYGWIFPGIFSHPGISPQRVLTLCTVEFYTGIFASLSQIALTLVAAFLLMVGIASGFGCQESLINIIMGRVGRRSIYAVPQTATLSSFAVATISGSGAANAAATGQFTIPLMKRYGIPAVTAAAVETASSMGGQLLPPVMGVAAFIMTDFLGVTYFDVIIRGAAIGIIYYLGVILAVYLMSLKFMDPALRASQRAEGAKIDPLDKFNAIAFFSSIALLILLMTRMIAEMYAALLASAFLLALAMAARALGRRRSGMAAIGADLARRLMASVETFASLLCDIGLLLATLDIMVGLFSATGVPVKIGLLMMGAGGAHMAYMIAIAFAFGYIVGLGLPPSATYITTALVVAPIMIGMGINPWVAHFFAFLVAVMSELSPPTSVTAAVAARIADCSFNRAMLKACEMAIPLYIMMFSIFIRAELVMEPGPSMLWAFAIVLLGVLASVAGIHAAYGRNPAMNLAMKALAFISASIAAFHPDSAFATAAAIASLPLTILGIFRTRAIFAGRAGPSPSRIQAS
ncbi:MAG: TRAP transporter fused permease subunit [Candidatus Bathyarchaeia archaeon]